MSIHGMTQNNLFMHCYNPSKVKEKKNREAVMSNRQGAGHGPADDHPVDAVERILCPNGLPEQTEATSGKFFRCGGH